MQVLDATRLCIDCVHLERRTNVQYAHCLHPAALRIGEFLVAGDAVDPRNYFTASVQRGYLSVKEDCGPGGKHWQSRHLSAVPLQLSAPEATVSIWGWLRTKIAAIVERAL